MKVVRRASRSEIENLAAGGAFVGVADLSKAQDKISLTEPIAKALNFPDYYSQNWDSFEECVGDLEWIAQDRVALVLDGFSEAEKRLPSEFEMLDDILEGATVSLADYGKTFEVVCPE